MSTLTWKRVTTTLFADTAYPRPVAYWVADTGPTADHYYAIERGYSGYEGYTGYTTWRLPRTVEFFDKNEQHQIGYGAEATLAAAKRAADEMVAACAAHQACSRCSRTQ